MRSLRVLQACLMTIVFVGNFIVSASAAYADSHILRTAVVYGLGFKLDKSFNESAFHGVLELRKKGLEIMEFSPQLKQERIPILEHAALNADHVIAIGFPQSQAVMAVASKYPDTKFTTIGGMVFGKNIQAVNFREHEGTFLAGIAAAMSSKSKTIGFVGGMHIPVIKRFQAGYEQGARYAVKDIKVLSRFIGSTSYAFRNPMGGYLSARDQIQNGADVVFAAAGSSGLGAYQAAEEGVAYAIGVDSNQNHLFPTTMLTSLVKEVGKTIVHVVTTANNGQWSNKPKSFGLKEGAFSLALDNYNALHYTEDVRNAVHDARIKIITGKIKVSPEPSTSAPVGLPLIN